MPTRTATSTGWTKLNATAGPAAFTAQLVPGPITPTVHLLLAAADPGPSVVAPDAAADALELNALVTVFSAGAALAGTGLNVWARVAQAGASATLRTTELL